MNAPGDRADVLIRLLNIHAVAEMSDRKIVVRRPAWIFAAQIGWQPQIHVWRKTKCGGEHTDNGVDRAINLQVCLREIPRRSELLPPISIADKNSRVGPFFRVAGGEIPPEDRLNTENLEKVGGHARDRRARRLRGTGNGHDVIIVFCNGLEAAVLVAKVVEVRIRKMCPPSLRANLEDGHDPARIGVRQRPQQNAIYNAENCRGRADAQRERKGDYHGDTEVFAELAETIAAIGEHGAKPVAKPLLANLFFDLFDSAQFDSCGS